MGSSRKRSDGHWRGGSRSSSRGGGRSSGRSRQSERPSEHRQWAVEVRGFSGRSARELESVFNRNCSRQVRFTNKRTKGDGTLVYSFSNESDAREWGRQQNITLHGRRIQVSLLPPGGVSKLSPEDMQNLAGFVQAQWQQGQQQGLLSLQGLSQQAAWTSFHNESLCSALGQLLRSNAHMAARLTTLDLSNNRIERLDALKSAQLHVNAPNLVNLSLASNNIKSADELAKMGPVRKQLRALLLQGNPCQTQARCVELYHDSVSRALPALQQLDGAPLRPIIALPVPPSLKAQMIGFSAPTPKPSFFGGNVKPVVLQTLQMFFQLFDGDRGQLLDWYLDCSSFSLTCTASSKKVSKQHMHVERSYAPLNANALKDSIIKQLHTRVSRARFAIIEAMRKLPPTKHDLGFCVVDAMPLPTRRQGTLLQVVVHGQFMETDVKVMREFSRVLLLVSVNDQPRILSDQL
ncbi:MAG: hypothetical protein MHM6MM_005470 [Cercozoa sp. M6MM]